jgi:anaerobic ribonucleoside-triphosphate reductase activating protein
LGDEVNLKKDEIKFQIAGFLDNSLVNGMGLRSVVFVSGCNHNCDGCHNAEMQDFHYGEQLNVIDLYERIKDNLPIIKGVTFSGGEPLEYAEALSKLGSMVKELGLNLWCYTGYTYEHILEQVNDKPALGKLLAVVDVLVDGRFEKDKADPNLKYRGSVNQRLIDVKESLREGKTIVLDF